MRKEMQKKTRGKGTTPFLPEHEQRINIMNNKYVIRGTGVTHDIEMVLEEATCQYFENLSFISSELST